MTSRYPLHDVHADFECRHKETQCIEENGLPICGMSIYQPKFINVFKLRYFIFAFYLIYHFSHML